jgi:cbb3-type cytochrome oxidase subunit 3
MPLTSGSFLTNPSVVTAAHATLVIGFVIFAALHIAWLIYIWRFDFKWKYAQAVQRECGKNAMERETVRWQMYQLFNQDTTLKSLVNFTYSWFALYLVICLIACIPVVMATNDKFDPMTVGFPAFLEKLQAIPTKVYVSLVTLLFMMVTISKVRQYFGDDRLKNLMKDYETSITKIEKDNPTLNMTLMKDNTRTHPIGNNEGETFTDLQALREEVVKNIAIAHNTESLIEADTLMTSIDPKELVGYLQMAKARPYSHRCAFVKDDVIRFSKQEINDFIKKLQTAKATTNTTISLREFKKGWSTAFKAKYPQFMDYVNKLTTTKWADFLNTWWEGDNLRINLKNYKDNNVWDDAAKGITKKICEYYNPYPGSLRWDRVLYDLNNMDPSPSLKPMVRSLKVYFAITLVFIMAILYMLVPKAKILLIAVVSLMFVFLYAYLMQFA